LLRADPIPPLGLAHLSALEVPQADLVALAARIGYGAVGLRRSPATLGGVHYDLPLRSVALREVRARLLGEGLSVHDIEFVVLDDDFDPARIGGLLETACALGAKRISACGYDRERTSLTSSFAALCEQADRFGLGVDLEGMVWKRGANISDATAIVVAGGRAYGGVLVDALHLCRAGGGPRDVASIGRQLIKSVQLCDALRPATREAIIAGARNGRLPPGEGELPLGELVAAVPLETAFSLEMPMSADEPAERRARRIFAAGQSLFMQLGRT
jgi:sugar phosphate isomerase/epimerase